MAVGEHPSAEPVGTIFSRIAQVALSTPVFAIANIVLGIWLAEAYDMFTYQREGDPRTATPGQLRRRLLWTRLILTGAWPYPNAARRLREVERLNRLLTALNLPLVPEELPAAMASAEYMRKLSALIGAVGIDDARKCAAKLKASAPSPKRRSRSEG